MLTSESRKPPKSRKVMSRKVETTLAMAVSWKRTPTAMHISVEATLDRTSTIMNITRHDTHL
jgi:hypothetical protein